MDEKDRERLRAFTAVSLTDLFPGTDQQWWHKRFPVLRSDGVLSKVGAKHFGTIAGVEAWLTRSHEETTGDEASV